MAPLKISQNGVGVGVGVSVGVGVCVGVSVGVAEGEPVGVNVGVSEGVGVFDGTNVSVGVGVSDGIRVLVGMGGGGVPSISMSFKIIRRASESMIAPLIPAPHPFALKNGNKDGMIGSKQALTFTLIRSPK